MLGIFNAMKLDHKLQTTSIQLLQTPDLHQNSMRVAYRCYVGNGDMKDTNVPKILSECLSKML